MTITNTITTSYCNTSYKNVVFQDILLYKFNDFCILTKRTHSCGHNFFSSGVTAKLAQIYLSFFTISEIDLFLPQISATSPYDFFSL